MSWVVNLEKAGGVVEGIWGQYGAVNENAKTGEAAQSHSDTKRKVREELVKYRLAEFINKKRGRAVSILTALFCPRPASKWGRNLKRSFKCWSDFQFILGVEFYSATLDRSCQLHRQLNSRNVKSVALASRLGVRTRSQILLQGRRYTIEWYRWSISLSSRACFV